MLAQLFTVFALFATSNGYFSRCSAATKALIGSGWQLVRRVGPSHNKWHPAVDQLRGTQAYGTFINNDVIDRTFSQTWNAIPFNQFLFMMGDCSRWLITSKAQAISGWYANAQRWVCKSNGKSSQYLARWYHRNGHREDPWISVIDHGPALHSGNIVYGENNVANSYAAVIRPKNGANVFIRNAGTLNQFGCQPAAQVPYFSRCNAATKALIGSGWQLVRRVGPSHNRWHPAVDQLRGTQAYGTFINNDIIDHTFSRTWNTIPFNQFLFMTGDCSRWLITGKNQAIGGRYANAQRWVCKSNVRSTNYLARWYHRNGHREDPWISTIDHGAAVPSGNIVYGENNFGSTHAATVIRPRKGANVYIRNMAGLASNGCKGGPPVKTCPSKSQVLGYTGQKNDVPGCGVTSCGSRYDLKTIAQCEARCIANHQCNTFSWAPLNGDPNHSGRTVCTLYSQLEPTSAWKGNQVFCKPTQNKHKHILHNYKTLLHKALTAENQRFDAQQKKLQQQHASASAALNTALAGAENWYKSRIASINAASKTAWQNAVKQWDTALVALKQRKDQINNALKTQIDGFASQQQAAEAEYQKKINAATSKFHASLVANGKARLKNLQLRHSNHLKLHHQYRKKLFGHQLVV